MRLIGYLRVSTDQQETGPDVQRAAVERWLEGHHDHTVVAWLTDEDVSGKTDLEQRPALGQAFRMVGHGEADGLVVFKLDRLARDLIVQEQLLAELWRIGPHVEVFSCSPAESSYAVRDDPGDPSRKMIRQILGAVSEYERAMIRLRMMAGAARKRESGGYAGGRPPFGWRAEDGRLVEDPAEQVVLGRIRQLRRARLTLRSIAEQLNAEGFRRPAGGMWRSESVRRALGVEAGPRGAGRPGKSKLASRRVRAGPPGGILQSGLENTREARTPLGGTTTLEGFGSASSAPGGGPTRAFGASPRGADHVV